MMLLVACGIDANDKVVPIAWALVPIENELWWTWFLRYLKHCIPIFETEDQIFISDREKGMANAVSTVFDKSIHLHCCQHIADNLQQRYGNKVRPLFWQACRAKTPELFAQKMEDLKAQSQPAFEYLSLIKRSIWTRAYSTYPRYGHDTSNIVESLNSVWSDIRNLPPLQIMDSLYSYAMKLVYNRSTTKQKLDTISDIPMARFQQRFKTSRRLQVYPSGNRIAEVKDPESSRKWIVNLTDHKCDCEDFYEYQSPCSHAIAVARYFQIDPISLFDTSYFVKAYRKTYSRLLLPISIENITPDKSIKPPIIKKQAGRPKTKRIRKGSWEKRQTRCGNCLNWGHNKRRCTNQPVSSGRKERAYHWLEEVGVEVEVEVELRVEIEESESESGNENEIIVVEDEDRESDILSELESDQFEDEIEGVIKELVSYTRSGKVRK